MRVRHLPFILMLSLLSSLAFALLPRVANTNPTSGPTGTQFPEFNGSI